MFNQNNQNDYRELPSKVSGAVLKKLKINADINGAYNIMVKENPNNIIFDRKQLRFNPTLIKL